MLLLYIAIGGALGSVSRYLVMSWVSGLMGKEFPYGTLAVNILGGLMLGMVIGLVATILPRGRELHALVAIGFLGGFTTFSTFSMDLYLLMERGQLAGAAMYTLSSIIVSVLAFFIGMWIFRSVVW